MNWSGIIIPWFTHLLMKINSRRKDETVALILVASSLFQTRKFWHLLYIIGTGGRVGVVVRALAFHQCGPGSISALGVKCGLSLLVLDSAMRGFSPGTPVFPSPPPKKSTFHLISFDL